MQSWLQIKRQSVGQFVLVKSLSLALYPNSVTEKDPLEPRPKFPLNHYLSWDKWNSGKKKKGIVPAPVIERSHRVK